MTAPTPQPLSATLWNQLIGLGDDDRVGLDKINWQLRKLVKDRPTDFDARISLAYGLLLSGDREGGIHHIDIARGFWHSSSYASPYDFISLLTDVGRLADARDFIDRLDVSDFEKSNEIARNVLCAYGVRCGDINWVNRGIQVAEFDDQYTCELIQDIEQRELVFAFRLHQELVESIVGPFSCTFDSSINIDDSGRPKVSVRYYTTLVGRERLQLYRRIAELKVDPEVIRVSSFISVGILGPQIQSIEVAA